VQSVAQPAPTPEVAPVQVRVLGPDAASLTAGDLRRLFRGRHLTPARRDRLSNSGRVVAACGKRVVGLAAYDRVDDELRVHEFAVVDEAPCRMDEIACVLLEALETACLAGGGRRLVMLPRASIAERLLRVRGFLQVAEGCAGSWFEKLFPS
jgi:hypothetical protein